MSPIGSPDQPGMVSCFPPTAVAWQAVNRLLARGVPVAVETEGDRRFVVAAGHGQELGEVFAGMGRVAKASAVSSGSERGVPATQAPPAPPCRRLPPVAGEHG